MPVRWGRRRGRGHGRRGGRAQQGFPVVGGGRGRRQEAEDRRWWWWRWWGRGRGGEGGSGRAARRCRCALVLAETDGAASFEGGQRHGATTPPVGHGRPSHLRAVAVKGWDTPGPAVFRYREKGKLYETRLCAGARHSSQRRQANGRSPNRKCPPRRPCPPPRRTPCTAMRAPSWPSASTARARTACPAARTAACACGTRTPASPSKRTPVREEGRGGVGERGAGRGGLRRRPRHAHNTNLHPPGHGYDVRDVVVSSDNAR
jgi:hypothetical protein